MNPNANFFARFGYLYYNYNKPQIVPVQQQKPSRAYKLLFALILVGDPQN